MLLPFCHYVIMQVLLNSVILTLSLFGLAQAGHVPVSARRHSRASNDTVTLRARTNNVRLSYYDITETGNEVACGGHYQNSDWVGSASNFTAQNCPSDAPFRSWR